MNDRQRLLGILIDRHEVTSQGQLVELLHDHGVAVTQATVSRDLERLGAVRVRSNGHMVYALPALGEPADPAQILRDALGLVRSSEASGNLLVLRTAPANAMPVASALDRADLPIVCGTVAGDDTLVLVAREPSSGREIHDLLQTYLGEETNA